MHTNTSVVGQQSYCQMQSLFCQMQENDRVIVGCNHYFLDIKKVVILYDNLCRKLMFLRYILYCIMISACLTSFLLVLTM